MTLDQALLIFEKSNYSKDIIIEFYVNVKEGIILIPKIEEFDVIDDENSFFLVDNNGQISITNPLRISWNLKNVKNIH